MPSPISDITAPVTVLAFDFGTHVIGVAVGQSISQTAQALPPLKAKDGIPHWDEIGKTITEWQPDQLVVGLPLNMDGSEGELTPLCRKFGNRLRERFQLPVEFMDERLSSFAARQEVIAQGQRLDVRKRPVDSIAARLILESWFHHRVPSNMR